MRRVHVVLLAMLFTCSLSTTSFGQGRGFRGGRGPDDRGRGPDSDFVTDRDVFQFLLAHHDEVKREVKELKDGVQTLTESDNEEVVAKIQQHVAAMYQRVENIRPIRMRDPLFAEIFRHAAKIKLEFERTPKGVRVTETSDDAYVATLIKSHAKVVSGFAKYGFEEAHKTHAVPGTTGTSGGPMHAGEELAFVEFDRIYIPALALSNQMKPEAAVRAVGRLSKSWDTRFVERFHAMFTDDVNWPRDVSRIAQAIALAKSELESDELSKAHEQLEPVRDILLNARRRNKLEYALDALSQFHATMEAIVKPAMSLDATSIDQPRIEEFRKLAEQADQQWQAVEQTKFDLGMFGKNDQQQQQFGSMLRAEGAAIAELKAVLENGDQAAILKAARGLKPPFAKVYMFFGDFDS